LKADQQAKRKRGPKKSNQLLTARPRLGPGKNDHQIMSDSKHTPGPWIKDGGFIRGKNDVHVCLTTLYEKPIEERDANQNLICAAPEMLEALEQFCNYCNKLNLEFLTPEYEKALSIIKKAKGE
jgi:hypothetical protein